MAKQREERSLNSNRKTMGGVTDSETMQWFLEIKAKILKWYSEFGKIIGGTKKNQW